MPGFGILLRAPNSYRTFTLSGLLRTSRLISFSITTSCYNIVTYCVAIIFFNSLLTFPVCSDVLHRQLGQFWRSVRFVINQNALLSRKISLYQSSLFPSHLFALFYFLPCLFSAHAMYFPSRPNARNTDFCNLPTFSVSQYLCKYAKYLESLCFVARHESGTLLWICDRNKITSLSRLGTRLSDVCIAEVRISPSCIISVLSQTCRFLVARRKLSTSLYSKIWFEGAPSVMIWKYPFLESCFDISLISFI